MKRIYPVKEVHTFSVSDYVAGSAPVDFVNTVTGANDRKRDWLADPAALVDWAFNAGILTEAERTQLALLYETDRKLAVTVLDGAATLREAMSDLLKAAITASSPPQESLDIIERAWRAATAAARIGWSSSNGLLVINDRTKANLIIDRLAMDFVTLGSALLSPRLHRCEGSNCGWFFFDTSKGGQRRWCDMATCGNAAKYARSRS